MPDNSEDLTQDFVIVLDSIGIKLTNRGEWLSKKHGKVSHMKVTDNRTHDSQCAIGLLENSMEKTEALGGKVKEVIADTGYDIHEIFRYLGRKGIKPVIKVREGVVIIGNRAGDEVVRAIRKGKKKWRKINGYGRRWHVESFFSSFKGWFGEYVSSVKFENIRKELMFKVVITSMFLSGGVGMLVS